MLINKAINRNNNTQEILKMRLVFKSVVILIFAAAAAVYVNGCTSAEQTTAKLAFQQGDYQKAEKEFQIEVTQNPANEEAWYYLGASRIMLKKYPEADDAFIQYRKIGKNSFRDEILDAWTKRYNAGADKFEAGQKVKDQDVKLKDFQDAIDEFKVCKIILPDSTVVDGIIKSIDGKIAGYTVNPIIDKGVTYDSLGQYDQAITQYNLALQKVEKGSAMYEVVAYDIAVSNLKWGEKLRNANSDDPAYKDKYSAAMPYLEDLTKSKDVKTQYTAYDLLVQVYANLGMNDKALDAMKVRDSLKDKIK
jgi:tetratricopeptide (TPR) repeat protein